MSCFDGIQLNAMPDRHSLQIVLGHYQFFELAVYLMGNCIGIFAFLNRLRPA